MNDEYDVNAYYALSAACQGGHTDLVYGLLQIGAGVNFENSVATYEASCKGYTEIVKLLIAASKHGVGIASDWALVGATIYGNKKIVKLLLDAGANVHSSDGKWAVHYASIGNHPTILKLLLDPGADKHEMSDVTYRKRNWMNDISRMVKSLFRI